MSAVFAALADPTRRRIVELLTSDGPATATSLSAQLNISRQAVARHLALLDDADLAQPTRTGRETRFELTLEALDDVTRWVDQVSSDWSRRLALLAASVEEQQGDHE